MTIKTKKESFKTIRCNKWTTVNGYTYKHFGLHKVQKSPRKPNQMEWCLVVTHYGLSLLRSEKRGTLLKLLPLFEDMFEDDGSITRPNLKALQRYLNEHNFNQCDWNDFEPPSEPCARAMTAPAQVDVVVDGISHTIRCCRHRGRFYYSVGDLQSAGAPQLYRSNYKGQDDILSDYRHDHKPFHALCISGLYMALEGDKGTPQTLGNLKTITSQLEAFEGGFGPEWQPIPVSQIVPIASCILNELRAEKPATTDTNQPTPVAEEIIKEPNPQSTQIDWQAFVVEHEGRRGISLRAMVEAGLYARYEDARNAVDRGNYKILRFSRKLNTHGPSAHDALFLDMRDAQIFAARCRSDVGERILNTILDHHDELQAMLNGDVDALARHEDARVAPVSADPLDVMMAQIQELKRQRDQLNQHTARLEALEDDTKEIRQRFGQAVPAEDMTAREVAIKGNWYSINNRPHNALMVAVGRRLDLIAQGLMYETLVPVNEDSITRMGTKHMFKPQGAALILEHINKHLVSVEGSSFCAIEVLGTNFTIRHI